TPHHSLRRPSRPSPRFPSPTLFRSGVDLAEITASGPGGAVTSADVERAARAQTAAGPVEPLAGVRRAMAVNMARSHAEIVPATEIGRAHVLTPVTVRSRMPSSA